MPVADDGGWWPWDWLGWWSEAWSGRARACMHGTWGAAHMTCRGSQKPGPLDRSWHTHRPVKTTAVPQIVGAPSSHVDRLAGRPPSCRRWKPSPRRPRGSTKAKHYVKPCCVVVFIPSLSDALRSSVSVPVGRALVSPGLAVAAVRAGPYAAPGLAPSSD